MDNPLKNTIAVAHEDVSMVPVTDSVSPGQVLRAAREHHGLTVQDIAKRLRLSSQRILDLEADDYSHDRALIYVHGHLKAYAREVNLDGAGLLDLFRQSGFGSHLQVGERLPTEGAVIQRSQLTHRSRRTWRWLGVLLLVVLCGLVALWWYSQRSTLSLHKPLLPTTQALSVDHSAVVRPASGDANE